MRKAALVIALVSVLVLGLSAGAMAASDNSAWVKVPFAFYAGKTLLPAGTYLFSMKPKPFEAGSVLRIVNKDGTVCEHLYTNRIEGNPSDPEIHLYFNKYGDSYFLSKMKGSLVGAEVARSSNEKEMERASLAAKPIALSPHSAKPMQSNKK